MKKTSAGLLMYRFKKGEPEILLVHPGGPHWKNKDNGSWDIPKGEADNDEEGAELLEVAKREFEEETSFLPHGEFRYLGEVVRKDGKRILIWTVEGDCDPSKIKSNTVPIEWPPKSGTMIDIPEVDRGAFFTIAETRKKIFPSLLPLLDAFQKIVA
jgi:predicted NUDIX family NTP pyrophosphohydrolase